MARTDSSTPTLVTEANGDRCVYVSGVKVACFDVDGNLKLKKDIMTNETL